MQVGAEIPAFTVDQVDAARMKTIAALMRDPNPIHWDAGEARKRGLGDRSINQGPANIAYIMNMLADFAGDRRAIRRLRLRCLGMVFAGDRVVARGKIEGLREDAGERLIDCAVWLERDGERILEGSAIVAIPAVGGSHAGAAS
ncbi:MaoC family dehydratase [Terrarubrum flagellatum]|uniref:MaoC family dehydratase n=1 Tax=Terrirubrum flagellatum TaxID=2895980 RepID=UPI0031453DD8